MLDPPHGQPTLRLTGGAHRPVAHQPESRPTRGLDLWWGAARARCGRGHGVARGDGEQRRREAAQRGEAGAGQRVRARGGDDGGEAHQWRRGQGTATRGRRDGARRLRAEALAGGPAGRGRRPGKGPNWSRMGRARARALDRGGMHSDS